MVRSHRPWNSCQVTTPDGALEAIRTARKKFTANKPLGFDLGDEIDDARAKMKAATRSKN